MDGRPLPLTVTRRRVLAAGCAALVPGISPAAAPELAFDELYARIGVLGMEFSQKVLDLNGQRVRITGFMAPPLKAEADFFVLGKAPMAICPFCSSDADWPDDILVVYLRRRQTFAHLADMIVVEGVLEHGSWTDPETGFVSLLRLRDADYRRI
ncbi:hypothetical protein [Paracoccus siganidrum]|uniref:DUF3299 domain-containing protein n=1 Tax=Paracoccus siganidrum TaxID=1276757 RepID=A0A418ZTW4_9RHOB|nr:hypothetical protein [Paracoccus siganidrum]RJL02303.1 hypothetical protein D3P05_21895 [Paracoccus siganidrum]RMC24731.1 hypothetical protein C9E82_23305 [Paracoccus siganidrum]